MEIAMATTTVDYAGQVLTDVRGQIAADDDVLKEAKERRNLVTKRARSFDGALKSFNSGSVAHGTVNKPVSDADAGIVLDRRTYPELGPDGDDEPPNEIVEAGRGVRDRARAGGVPRRDAGGHEARHPDRVPRAPLQRRGPERRSRGDADESRGRRALDPQHRGRRLGPLRP